MKINKRDRLRLFIIITTISAIILNFENSFMGNYATIFNLEVSTVFLLLWFILSIYCGLKNEKSYKKFTLIYWGINIITFLLVRLTSIISFDGTFLIPFAMWYGFPVYGLRYLINEAPSTLNLISTYISFLINFLGYFIGYCIYKFRIKGE